MNTKKWNYFFNKKFFKFCAVGGSVALLSYFLLYLFIDVIHLEAKSANILQLIISVELNFLLNNFITWKEEAQKSNKAKQFIFKLIKFNAARFLNMFIAQVIFTLLIGKLNYIIINTINVVFATLLNYITSEEFVFKNNNKNSISNTVKNLCTDRRLVSIVVPTLNEYENIDLFCDKVSSNFNGIDYQIIFVDDSTDDKTVEKIGEWADKSNRVSLIHREQENRTGLASAVLLGMQKSNSRYLITLDVDLQHPVELIRGMFDYAIENDCDIIFATRYSNGGDSSGLGSFFRVFVSKFSKGLARLLFYKKLKQTTDCLSGCFLFKKNMVDLHKLNPIGWKIGLEILVMGNWSKYSEQSYKFGCRHGGISKASLKQGLIFLLHLISLLFRYYMQNREGMQNVTYFKPRP